MMQREHRNEATNRASATFLNEAIRRVAAPRIKLCSCVDKGPFDHVSFSPLSDFLPDRCLRNCASSRPSPLLVTPFVKQPVSWPPSYPAHHQTTPACATGCIGAELGFPLPHRFVAENEATGQEHLRQIPQAQLVAQAPKYHEGDDIAGVLRLVQHIGAALVELLAAFTTADGSLAPCAQAAPG